MSVTSDAQELPVAAVLLLVGALLLSIGVGIIYLPLGFIAAGGLALWFGIDATRDVPVSVGAGEERSRGPGLRAVSEAS